MNEGFTKIGEAKDIPSSTMKVYDLAGESVCIVNTEGNCYAIGNICTDEGGPLNEDAIEGYNVECAWHGSKFDVRTGTVTEPPAELPVQSYEVKIEDGDNFIRKIN